MKDWHTIFCEIAIAALLAVSVHATARTSSEDYEYVQKLRSESDKEAEKGSAADLQHARETLLKALEYLDREEVRERAEGSPSLYGRRHDVHMQLAMLCARMKDRNCVVRALEDVSRVAWVPVVGDWLEKDADMAPYLSDAKIRELIDRIRLPRRLWSTPAIATPYKERLSVEERVAGLSLFWSEVRHGFVHFDNVPEVEWDAVYLDFLHQVMAAETTREYYDVLMRLAPLLRDSHTNIYPPKELQEGIYSRPPIRTALIDGRVLVTEVRSAKLAESVHVGDEVVSVDGLPVREYVAKRVEPYVSSSTLQDKRVRSYNYQLLAGDGAKPIAMVLRGVEGTERRVMVARTGYADVVSPKAFDFKMLPGDVAYLSLDHFESDAGVKAFEAVLPKIIAAKGLVLDVRRNGGGSTNHGLAILSYLTDQPIDNARSTMRRETSLDRARGDEAILWVSVAGSDRPYRRPRAQRFTGPVAVLAGPQTFSAAEDFLVSFVQLKRGAIVGEASGGSTGQPYSFKLPGGGTARVCVKRDTFRDGTRFVGVGVQPTVLVPPTVDGFRQGRDEALDAAVAWIGKQ